MAAGSALVIVDYQNDFALPNGSLPVPHGLDVVPALNQLLRAPFSVKVATQDWHPADHISFAANHTAPNNVPFESVISVPNPVNPSESLDIHLWPVHCVENTKGAEIVDGIDTSKVDVYVKKGQDKRVEMFSAFRDSYETRVVQSSLLDVLRKANIERVYCVGLCFDLCVKETALHAAESGFQTFIIEEGTKAVNPAPEAIKNVTADLERGGVQIVSMKSLDFAMD